MNSLKEQIDRELQGVHFDVEGFMGQWETAREGEDRHRKARRNVLAAAVAAAFFCCSGGVYASVNHFRERGLQLTQEEKDAYVEDLTNAPVEADTFSREMTEAERERRGILMDKYRKEGLYPKEKLKKIKSEEERLEDRVCFLPETSTFYLPERELTDEDLLQIIDHDLMVDYSLAQARRMEREGQKQGSGKEEIAEQAQNGQEGLVKRQAQNRQEEHVKRQAQDGQGQRLTESGMEEISMEEAIASAKEVVRKVYGEDVGSLEVKAEKDVYTVDGEEEPNKDGEICLTRKDRSAQYEVIVNLKTKEIETINFGGEQDNYLHNSIKPGDVLEENLLNMVKEKTCILMGEDTSIQKGYVQVITNQEGNLANGVFTYYLEMDNGKVAEVCYSKATEKVISLWNNSRENFRKNVKETKEYYEEAGFLYQITEFH